MPARSRLGLGGFVLAAAGFFCACSAAPPPPVAMAVHLPPQSSCPTVANVDLRAIARLQARAAESAPRDVSTDLDEVVVPATASRRPPADAVFIARVRLPPGGGYARDERAVIWRETDGSWWGWRQVRGGQPPSPLPPPAPGTPEADRMARDIAEGYPWYYDSVPTFEGRLDAEQAARMESAFAHPCRRLEPDRWPAGIPLLRREEGSRTRRCPFTHHPMSYRAEFTEAGGPPRRITLPCGAPGTLNGILVTWSAHADLPPVPPRRLTRDEIDAMRRDRPGQD